MEKYRYYRNNTICLKYQISSYFTTLIFITNIKDGNLVIISTFFQLSYVIYLNFHPKNIYFILSSILIGFLNVLLVCNLSASHTPNSESISCEPPVQSDASPFKRFFSAAILIRRQHDVPIIFVLLVFFGEFSLYAHVSAQPKWHGIFVCSSRTTSTPSTTANARTAVCFSGL